MTTVAMGLGSAVAVGDLRILASNISIIRNGLGFSPGTTVFVSSLAILTLGGYLAHRADFEPLAQPKVKGEFTDTVSLVTNQAGPSTLEGFKGKAIGGTPLASGPRHAFHLDIKITDGTNTKSQKAAYVQRVFDELAALLAPLDPTSYIVIDDVRADAWGFGGRTQEARFIAASTL